MCGGENEDGGVRRRKQLDRATYATYEIWPFSSLDRDDDTTTSSPDARDD